MNDKTDFEQEYQELKRTGKLKDRYMSIAPPHGLLSALLNEDYDIAAQMLEEEPDLVDRKRDGYSETALQWMVTENALEQVRFLLTHGADASAPDDFGDTPLNTARKMNYAEMEALLLSHLSLGNTGNNSR